MLLEVRKERPDAVLVFVGPDHADGHCQRFAWRVRSVDAVRFTGWSSDVGE